MLPQQNIYESTSTRVSGFILLFFILVSFFWIVGYSFNFSFLRCKGKRSCKDGDSVTDHEGSESSSSSSCPRKEQLADPGRTFVFAIIVSLIILLLLWAFWSTRKC
jgi:hypothetical protein